MDIQKIIKQTVKITVNELIQNLTDNILKTFDRLQTRKVVTNCYKETEKLLYNYMTLKQQIIITKRDIEDLEKEGYTESSKDIIISQKGGTRQEKDEIQHERIQKRYYSMLRTEEEVRRIDRALELIKDIDYYWVVSMRYFDGMQIGEIAEAMKVSVKTIVRNRDFLVSKLSVLLFGVDAI